jgi:hypothetical protein
MPFQFLEISLPERIFFFKLTPANSYFGARDGLIQQRMITNYNRKGVKSTKSGFIDFVFDNNSSDTIQKDLTKNIFKIIFLM